MRARKKAEGQYHHGDLRSALLAAAWTVVDRRGLDALSLREVDDTLGVSHAAHRHYFPTKDALLVALREEAWKRFADALESTKTLRDAARAYVQFATAHPRQMQLMFLRATTPAPPAGRAWEALVAHVRAAIGPKRAASEKELAAMTLVAWSQVHGLSQLLLNGPLPEDFPLKAIEDRVYEVFDAAVRR